MQTTLIAAAARLSDADLRRRVTALAGGERFATVELIAHLAEFDRRGLYRAEGFGSLFSYCTEALRLSENAAYKRILAARASRRLPVLLERLGDGSLSLSTLRLLAPHLTTANHLILLAEAKGRSKRDVERLVARLAPQADVPPSIRKLPAPAESPDIAPPAASSSVAAPALPPQAAAGERPSPRLSPPPPSTPRPVVAPLSPRRYRVEFTIDAETHEKLRRLQDLLRREVPNGDLAVIFDKALTLLLDDVATKKLAATSTPRPSRGRAANTRSRDIPAYLKREVWLRDGGQCAFVSGSGRRCRERAFLEFHHSEPHGVGGETTAANVSLHCRAHNVYEAELVFGRHEGVVRETPAHHATRNGPAFARSP